ncbi:hypothetical protein [Crossiella cryophila]|uniref:Uncharacterized protein n=1 Tax=Crossiella cryophila TaxID=43355 RepID=A0A7W7FRD1_9PSEU|nr:hypothetical protein [Crossiella cryophila]MBB4674810.1 hypothetical protein [Crossiella cryophila]
MRSTRFSTGGLIVAVHWSAPGESAELTEHQGEGRFEPGQTSTVHLVAGRAGAPPGLALALTYAPTDEVCLPAIHLMPSAETLFVGAGRDLLTYALTPGQVRRVDQDVAELGFFGWAQHGDLVLGRAELGLTGWSADGQRRWSAWAEPPWDYRVDGDRVRLDVMGQASEFALLDGPVSRTSRAR